jgi:hydroxymethylpyrimidine pyrophosphatase-like HAD family hydrolase
MYRRVFAFDFDGTLALRGRVEASTLDVLAELRQAEFAIFLVTGRRYQSLHLGPLGDLLTGIVWENGAVLQASAAPDVYLPFGRVDAHLVARLRDRKVPLEHGAAIVATWAQHEEDVWRAIAESGTEAAVAFCASRNIQTPFGGGKLCSPDQKFRFASGKRETEESQWALNAGLDFRLDRIPAKSPRAPPT